VRFGRFERAAVTASHSTLVARRSSTCHEMWLGRGPEQILGDETDSVGILASGGTATETDIAGRPAPGRSLYAEYNYTVYPSTHIDKDALSALQQRWFLRSFRLLFPRCTHRPGRRTGRPTTSRLRTGRGRGLDRGRELDCLHTSRARRRVARVECGGWKE